MRKIADDFCDYLRVGDDKYAYYVSNNIVTLLPAQSDNRKIYESFDRIQECYFIAKKLIAILTSQNNVYFEGYLS